MELINVLTVVYVLSLVLMAIWTNVKYFFDNSDNMTESKNTTDNSEMQFNNSTSVNSMVANQIIIMTIGI